MEDNDLPLIETRTAAGIDDRCGMRYWWNNLEAGTGIVPAVEPEALRIGREAHEDLAEVGNLSEEDLNPSGLSRLVAARLESVGGDKKVESLEHLYRRLGWMVAFGLFLEPLIRKEFQTVDIEAEITLDRDPLWVPITPDRVLRHREGKYLVTREWKSTITASPKWMASWPFEIQPHIQIAAIQEELGEKVAYGQVVGLLKGDKRGERLAHPYVWAYRSTKSGEWESDYNKARGSEWEHAPIWEFPGGPVEWVQRLGASIGLAQFPHSYPIFLNERMLADWVARRESRQKEIHNVQEECQLDWDRRILYFEPRTSQCRPAFGEECPYIRCCWNAEMNQNPLASDQFVRRVPHHELEIIGVE